MSDKIEIGTREIQLFRDRIEKEREARLLNAKNPMRFGVSFLDECFGGIFKNDLIVLGAHTGLGKTELATHIATVNAADKKRVDYFALEAEPFEIERRIKFKMVADIFFNMLKDKYQNLNFDYSEWYTGKLDAVLGQYEPEIELTLGECYPGLHTFYRHGVGDYTVETFKEQFTRIKDETDLVIIDHLHYFDSDDPNENRAVRDMVKQIRDIVLIVGKPVILISHVRKRDRKIKQLLPDIEDFHGTSDIGKICTRAIVLSQARGQCNDKSKVITYLRAPKNRISSNRTRFTAAMKFDIRKNAYESEYLIGFENDSNEFEPFTDYFDIPFWATSAKPYNKTGMRPNRGGVGL